MNKTAPIVRIDEVCKTFKIPGREPVKALWNISNRVQKGEVLVIIGPSGSGKSTLLRTLNGLQGVDSGRIFIDGVEITDSKTDMNKVRQSIGMVFQHFNLFEHKTALENVTLPQIVVLKRSKEEARENANKFLERVGIAGMGSSYPGQLSGGQQQRVAIARSLAMDPKIMLFDEATSALDPETVGGVLELMADLASEGMTMVVVTHEMGFAKKAADRMLFMSDGLLVEEGNPKSFFENPKEERLRTFLSSII